MPSWHLSADAEDEDEGEQDGETLDWILDEDMEVPPVLTSPCTGFFNSDCPQAELMQLLREEGSPNGAKAPPDEDNCASEGGSQQLRKTEDHSESGGDNDESRWA